MARFADYIDTEYLPGEIRQSTYGAAALNPLAITKYEANKRWKFEPGSADRGTSFQDFLNWQNNPQGAMLSKVKLPSEFLAFMQMTNGYN
jgi:hypothetical protein